MAEDTRPVLLVGGSGQVGQELVRRAWPTGVTLAAPPRTEADLTDRAAIAALVGSADWRAVINTAAWTAVDAAEDDAPGAFAANALGPAILADATRRRGIPLIHVSTDYVFDGLKPAPYEEDDRTHPLGVYGASKLAGEEAVRTGNPRHVIVRTAWVYGGAGKNFLRTMLRLGGDRDTLAVVDDQLGTPTLAADLAGALAAIALRDDLGERSGLYHFANRGETTWCGFARAIFALSAARGGPSPSVRAITTAEFPTPALRPANSRLATDRIVRDLGIVPRHWQDALASAMA